MSVRDDIASVRQSRALSEEGKRARIADLKAAAIKDAAPPDPVAIEWQTKRGAYAVTLNAVKKIVGGVEIDMQVSRDGKAVPFDGPWVVINPPVLIEAADGDIVRPIMRFDPKTMKSVKIGERRLKEAPLLALRQMLREFVEALP
jgi:hypothetical protein